MARRKDFNDHFYSLRRILASVVAGNEPVTALTDKLKDYIYESEEEYEKMLNEERNKKLLTDLLKNCTGVRVKGFSESSKKPEERNYDWFISMEYDNADAFIHHHANVKDVVQQIMSRERKVAKIYQTVNSFRVHPEPVSDGFQYEVELEGL